MYESDKAYASAGQLVVPTRLTIRQRLAEQKRTLTEALENIDLALKFMDDNPSFENFHNLVSKIGY